MKAVVAAFNQEKALVGAFSVITNLRMEFFEALLYIVYRAITRLGPVWGPAAPGRVLVFIPRTHSADAVIT